MIKFVDCAFQDGSYPCGYKDETKLPDCELCHKIRKAGRREMMDKVKVALRCPEILLYWRPKNWCPRAGLVERGADAMFNALIFQYGKYIADCEFPWVSKDGLTSGVQYKDGWQITIPADDVHKK